MSTGPKITHRICKDCRQPGVSPRAAAERMGELPVFATGICKLCSDKRRKWPGRQAIGRCPVCGVKIGHSRIAKRLGIARGINGYCTQHYPGLPRRRPQRGEEYLMEWESGLWQSKAELARHYGIRESSLERSIERYQRWREQEEA